MKKPFRCLMVTEFPFVSIILSTRNAVLSLNVSKAVSQDEREIRFVNDDERTAVRNI